MDHKTLEEFNVIDWCENFSHLAHHSENCVEFDMDDSKIFMHCILNEASIENDEKFKKEVREVAPIIQVIEKRLVLYNYTMTFAAIFALGMIFDDTLGTNTMNMTYLEYRTRIRKVNKVDMNFLGGEALPYGKLKESLYNRLWDEQKINKSPDNALDYPKVLQKLSNI